MEIANCGTPSINSLVPSIGSTTQTRDNVKRRSLSASSSDSQPSSGKVFGDALADDPVGFEIGRGHRIVFTFLMDIEFAAKQRP